MNARALDVGAITGLLQSGCGMITVVSEQTESDYALCIQKREAGGVAPEIAALDCAERVERVDVENV
jgi:hypothetical protein